MFAGLWDAIAGEGFRIRDFRDKQARIEALGQQKKVWGKRTEELMGDLCRCELGQGIIGALSFSWGSLRFKMTLG